MSDKTKKPTKETAAKEPQSDECMCGCLPANSGKEKPDKNK
jgi:hypothetical protein